MDACFNCKRPGHWAKDCTTDRDGAHQARIDSLVEAWADGRLTTGQKRKAISDENKSHYGAGARRALTWP